MKDQLKLNLYVGSEKCSIVRVAVGRGAPGNTDIICLKTTLIARLGPSLITAERGEEFTCCWRPGAGCLERSVVKYPALADTGQTANNTVRKG